MVGMGRKPLDSTLTIDSPIHDAVMTLRRRCAVTDVNEAVREGLRLGCVRPGVRTYTGGVPKATGRAIAWAESGCRAIAVGDQGGASVCVLGATFAAAAASASRSRSSNGRGELL
jgi:hypothetical protein